MRTILSLFTLWAVEVAAVDPLVKLSYASYRGTPLASGVTQWMGLPYAAPPVDDLRFAAPRDLHVEHKEYRADSVSFPLTSYSFYPIHLAPLGCWAIRCSSLMHRTARTHLYRCRLPARRL